MDIPTSCSLQRALCEISVAAKTIKNSIIAHRFCKETWPAVWAKGGKVLRLSSDPLYFEVKYTGFRELYLHSLKKSDYGPDKLWVLLAKRP